MNKFLLFLFIGIFSLTAMQVTAGVEIDVGIAEGLNSYDTARSFHPSEISIGLSGQSFERTDSVEISKTDAKYLTKRYHSSTAYYLLGDYYMRGGKKYYKKAFKLFEVAAKKGDAEAKYQLGQMYEEGLGVEQNFKEALKWYELADKTESIVVAKDKLEALQSKISSGKGKGKSKGSCATAIGN